MNCPVCADTLTPVQAGNVTVDVCLGGCGGIWFDQFELQKLDGPQESSGEILINVKRHPALQVDPAQRRCCPRCEDIVMMRHFYSPRRRVEVDECPSCGGFWLDAGELAGIREEQQNPAEQQAAVDAYVNEVSAGVLDPMRAAGTEQAVRARRIGQVFRFGSPLRYRRSE
jgi:uncharacterized protein